MKDNRSNTKNNTAYHVMQLWQYLTSTAKLTITKSTISKRILKYTCGLLLLANVSALSATPIISVDLDPLTPGVQSTLITTVGSSFTVDVTYTGDGVTIFDAFILDVFFSNFGPIIGLAGGTGMATAGSVAAIAPIPLDVFGGGPAFPGTPLISGGPVIPVPPYSMSSDLFGIYSMGIPFGSGIPIAAGFVIDLFSLSFDALTPGISDLEAFTFPVPIPGVSPVITPPPLGGLSLSGIHVPAGLSVSTVTVLPVRPIPTIPEPTTPLLIAISLIALACRNRMRQ